MTDPAGGHPKILAVSASDTSGGAARAAYRIHAAVRDIGIDSRMLVKNKGGNDCSVIDLETYKPTYGFYRAVNWGQNKIRNKIQQYTWSRYPRKKDVFMSDLRWSSLHGAIQKLDFEILHLHWINLRFLDLRELKKARRPIVWTLHDCWPFTGVCHYFYDCNKYESECGSCPMLGSDDSYDLSYKVFKKKRSVYENCNLHIVTPSRWLGQAASESALFKRFPVHVIPNPIDDQLYSPGSRDKARSLLGLDGNEKIILYGAMSALKDERKGFAKLKAALEKLGQQTGLEKLELAIFGTDQTLDDLEVGTSVRGLGIINRDELMAEAYRAADVTVVPSLSENLSNVIMESLACGTPVTAFNIGGNSDMIDHRQNGYLAKAFSPEDLAEGIGWCLRNNQAGKLSQHARSKVEKNYSAQKIALKYKELYQSIVGSQ